MVDIRVQLSRADSSAIISHVNIGLSLLDQGVEFQVRPRKNDVVIHYKCSPKQSNIVKQALEEAQHAQASEGGT